MKRIKRAKYVMLISWMVCILAAIVFCSVEWYFYQQGYRTDEDWLESGLTETIWGAVFIVSEIIALLGGVIATIASIVYLTKRISASKQ